MARFATDEEADLYARMRRTITAQHRRNQLRTNYAEAERVIEALDLRLPSGRQIEQTPLHWPAKAIEVFSSRLKPAFFTMRQGESLLEDLEDAYTEASGAFVEQLAIRSALRHGPAFIFSSLGDASVGEPDIVLSAQSALTATAILDPRTRRVTAALELLDNRRSNLYLPGVVLEVEGRGARLIVTEEYPATQRVMCAPYIHDATIEKPFGSSRVSRSVMGFTDAAVRTFMRQEVSAEWYSYPRERLLGVSPDAFEDAPGWVRAIGGIDALPDVHPDDDPNLPDDLRRAEVKFTPQMTMQPFSDQFRLIASQFSGASSIPLQYLGIVQDSNPTSAPAIEAQDIDLVRAVTDQQPSFDLGRRMLAQNILELLGGDVDPAVMRSLAPRWADPRVRSVRETSDFVKAQVDVGNFQAGTRATLDLLPISPEEARIHAEANQRSGGTSEILAALRQGAGTPVAPDGSGETAAELKAKFDALGVAIRAGVDPEDAAARLGLAGTRFTGGVPVSLRMPESEAARLEDK